MTVQESGRSTDVRMLSCLGNTCVRLLRRLHCTLHTAGKQVAANTRLGVFSHKKN